MSQAGGAVNKVRRRGYSIHFGLHRQGPQACRGTSPAYTE